jgi:two-component system chemotaxis response regulator CheB
MSKIHVFLVDDSSVVRRLVTKALSQDPALEVVGTAADGQIALNRLAELQPDVVLLDLEMPVMDGLKTLVALRKTHPRLPVIMFSRFTQRGVEATVHALTLGADDYVPKPGDGIDVESCIEELLIPKIKLLGQRARLASADSGRSALPAPSVPQPFSATPAPLTLPSPPRGEGGQKGPSPPGGEGRVRGVEIVVLGASTGGPNALAQLFPAFPANWPVPILIVQHMPPDFTARLAERLSEKSSLRVREGQAGELVSASQAWVAPGNHHMLCCRKDKTIRLGLQQEPPVNSCRPSVDVLFRSAAEVYGSGVLAVVLTGMGQDGLRGCECIRAAGGQVLVQDEASSVVWSMPGAVAQAGLADQILPLDHLGSEILRRVQRGSRQG